MWSYRTRKAPRPNSMTAPFPRLVVGGLSGDSGKTIVSLALVLAARRAGLPVRAYKKGPDYIDAAWLAWASGHPTRNLDTWLMGFPAAADSFTRTATQEGLNVIEGNRGLFDGFDAQGTHSTAALAKALHAPVVLVVDATKATRTVAACVLGCQKLDPDLHIGGVILNRCGPPRHQRVIREAIESVCGIPVLGAIPRIENPLPARHLGLIPPTEFEASEALLLEAVASHLDVQAFLALAASAPSAPPAPPAPVAPPAVRLPGSPVTIAYLRDSAFTFYYPENLEALESLGATLLPIDSLHTPELPTLIDALYIGGGFPETHAAELAANHSFLTSIRDAASAGLPIYAECGGLMLLSRAVRIDGRSHPMAGVLPFEVEQCARPQGHGYVELRVDYPNPFFPTGLTIRGHEFHYSRISVGQAEAPVRAAGQAEAPVPPKNVWASYTHVHALATPEWAAGLVAAARQRSL